jgi:putative hemolysin
MTVAVCILGGIALLTLVASALFSAAEVAIFSIRSSKLKSLKEHQGPKGDWINEVLAKPRKFLVTIFFGNIFANAALALSIAWICNLYRSDLSLGVGIYDWLLPMLISIGALLFVGELVPKAIATQRGVPIALLLVGWLRILEKQLRPLVGLFDRISQQWITRLTPSNVRPAAGLTEDEYLTMLDIGTREGTLRTAERRLIERTIHLANRNIRELMTPRSEMCCVDVELSLDEMKHEAAKYKHRRLPIYAESYDSIVGILNTRCFLGQPDADMMAWIEPTSFVPETMMALELLKNFIRSRQHMAMVVDEFGGVEGLITLEDILEEVFGEIYDEYDEELRSWEEMGAHVFKVHGFAHLEDISEKLGTDLEADGIDTIGGWITDRLGTMPRIGDRINFGGYCFLVEKMKRLRVASVLIWPEKKRRL